MPEKGLHAVPDTLEVEPEDGLLMDEEVDEMVANVESLLRKSRGRDER